MIGNLGQSEYEAILVCLSEESRLSTSNSSLAVLGVVHAEQGSAGIQVSTLVQKLGRGTKVDM